MELRQLFVPGRFEGFGGRLAARLRLEGKQAGILPRVGGRLGARSDAPLLDQAPVEPAGALVQDFGEHVERIAVDMAPRDGVIADLDRGWEIPLGVHPLLGQLVDLEGDHRRRGFFSR